MPAPAPTTRSESRQPEDVPAPQVTWSFVLALVSGFALAVGLTALAFYLNLGVHSDLSKWAYEINQKKRAIAQKTPSPKLLLVGGSGTLFGVSARQIEEATGCRTVNLATHAALGTAYILQDAEKFAKPGDTVLLVLEYELYTYGKLDQSWADKLLIDYIVARDPAFFYSLTPAEQWCVFMLTPNQRLIKGIKNRSRPERGHLDIGIYHVDSVNAWGDQINHTTASRPAQRAMQTTSALAYGFAPDPKGFAVIEAFCQWAKTNNIRVLATFPNLCDRPEYHSAAAQKAAEAIKNLYARLDVPVLGNYTDSTLPSDQFYDTVYHLTQEAATARTQRLLTHLAPYVRPAAVQNAQLVPAAK